MAVKQYKPTTPGRRGASVLSSADITATRPHKALVGKRQEHAGRNNHGKITVRHRGAGVKRMYRLVDFTQNKFDIPATVATIEYDPNRSARIALLKYRDGEHRYMLAPDGLQVGQTVLSSRKLVEVKVGNRMNLEYIPTGLMVHNIELIPGRGGRLVRSAGAGAILMSVEGGNALMKMPSGETRQVPKECQATIGQVSNLDWRNVRLGKAGRMRHYGIRPRVRGKAMNPVDHAHGGGEGNQPIGLKHPKTPWGKPALGVPTRRRKGSDRYIVKRRNKRS